MSDQVRIRPRPRGLAVVLIVLIAILLVLVGIYLARRSAPDQQVTPHPTSSNTVSDPFVSFAQRWTFSNPYTGMDDNVESHWLVGFTQSGKEIEIYDAGEQDSRYLDYLVSGENIYILQCDDGGYSQVISINYANESGEFVDVVRATFDRCIDQFTVMNDHLFYVNNDPYSDIWSNELIDMDLATGQTSPPFIIDFSQAMDDFAPGIDFLYTTRDSLFYSLNDETIRLLDLSTGQGTLLCERCAIHYALGEAILYAQEDEDLTNNITFYRYDPATGQSQILAQEVILFRSMVGSYIIPTGQGYVYTDQRNDYEFIYTDEHGEATVLKKFSEGYYEVVFPVSADRIMVCGYSGDLDEDSLIHHQRILDLQGNLLEGSDSQETYDDIRLPRYGS
jgi:hypothetical protein